MVDNPSPALAAPKTQAPSPSYCASAAPHRAPPTVPADAAGGDSQPQSLDRSFHLVDHAVNRSKRANWNAKDFERKAQFNAKLVWVVCGCLSSFLMGMFVGALLS